MVAMLRPCARGPVPESPITGSLHDRFVAMLPLIQQQSRKAFACERREEREELVQSAIAVSYALFVQLVQRDRADAVFPSALAKFAIRRVRSGRHLGTKLNRYDVTSPYARRFHKLQVERLDQVDLRSGQWKDVLVEDRRSGPAEIAAARLDIADWLRSLPTRLRQIANALSTGEPPSEVARQFEISRPQVSELRRQLMRSWERFQSPHDEPVSLCRA